MSSFKGLFLSLVLGVFASLPAASADDNFEYWPGAVYDAAIPSVKDVLGYESGDRITWPYNVRRYFDALAAAAPERVRIFDYAETWEGRGLFYVAISSPENIARLEEIGADIRRLSDPRSLEGGEAEALIASLPGTVWLGYGVHGNEISSTDAGMMTAYHLLAAGNDERTGDILANTIVFIDPMQNPDGRARFIHGFEMAEGLAEDSSRLAADHDEPWPGGRTNHYLFDMNRDWFAMTQPESRGRVAALQRWYPLAVVDLHEMGGDSTYYFAPGAVPFNPHMTDTQIESLHLFGRTNAKWFDKFGFDYFTREVFDALYPGYGDSWPSFYGAIGMTYEQASARGLLFRRNDGSEFHYRDTVRQHFVSSLGTAETVSVNRQKLLTDFYEFRQSAVAEGRAADVRSYIIPAQRDQSAADKLAGLMVAQGIEVGRADAGFRACGTNYAAGSYVVDASQPAYRLIRNLLDERVPLRDDFIATQEARRARGLNDEIYDVTAWSLPLMFNVTVNGCGQAVRADLSAAGPELVRPGSLSAPGGEAVAYLVPWGTAGAGRLLTAALQDGLSIKSPDEAFTLEGRTYPAGTLIFDASDNPGDLGVQLAALAKTSGAEVLGVTTTYVTAGPSMGSNKVVGMPAPRVAIGWDSPTGSSAAGNARFVIERQLGYPVTAMRIRTMARADLTRFDVIILPDTFSGAAYGRAFGKDGAANLKRWVEAGGVLVSLGGATAFLADPDTDLISIRREDAYREEDAKPSGGEDEESATVAGTLIADEAAFKASIQPDKKSPDSVAGVLVRAVVNPDHWMSAGVASGLNVLVRGRGIYTPAKLDHGVNVARFAGQDQVLASGYLWAENQAQLAYKPFIVAESKGRGQVIAFTQDPTVRAYLDGLNVILLNAIFRGAAHARPIR